MNFEPFQHKQKGAPTLLDKETESRQAKVANKKTVETFMQTT
jgi:hypothetical protein